MGLFLHLVLGFGLALAPAKASPSAERRAWPRTRTLTRSSTFNDSSSTGNNCDSGATNNAGCGGRAPGANSFGAAFNGAGGGWYAMERTNAFVKVWFWSRGAGNVPSEVRNGATTINTGNWVSAALRYAVGVGVGVGVEWDVRSARSVLTWLVPRAPQGTPFAYFPSQSCSIADHFDSHNLIINLSL